MKRSVILISAVLLAFGVDAQAQQQKSVSGPVISATPDGSSSVIVPSPSIGSPLRIAPISATAGGGSSAVNPSRPIANSSSVDVDISGVNSWDLLGDLDNELLTDACGGPGSLMTGIGWDVTIATVGASWLSESTIYFDGSDLDGSGLFLTPGVTDGFPGTATFSSGNIDLTDNGIPDIPVLADGLIHMEFFESFDDIDGAIDATYLATSTLTLLYDKNVVDITGVSSWDVFGDIDNELLTNDCGGVGSTMTGIGWDVTIMSVGASWLSEPTIYFDGSDLDGLGLFLTPGAADGFPGTATYSSGGIIDLSDAGIPDIPVLADGLIHMEFFESFDDADGFVDATYVADLGGAPSTLDLVYADCGTVTPVGLGGCAGNGGFTPAMTVTGCLSVGDSVVLDVVDMDGGSPYWLISAFGTDTPTTFLNGCVLDVNLSHVLFLGLTPGAGAGAGSASFTVSLPIAGTFFEQFVVLDSATGVVTSNALELVINP